MTGAARPTVGVEITCVGTFARPPEWGAGDKVEIDLIKKFAWHPTTKDMLRVANVPNEGKKRTDVVEVENLGGVFGAILFKDKAGKQPRPDRSVRRVNIISHGNPGLIGLGGSVRANGDVFITEGDLENPLLGSIDENTVDFLNSEAGKQTFFEGMKDKPVRDKIRDKFAADAHIVLLLCHAGQALGGVLASKLAKCLNVAVDAFTHEILYPRTFDGATITGDRTLTTVGFIETTNGPSGPVHKIVELRSEGRGFPCAVSVPAALEGKHLLPFDIAIPKPATPTP